jgi:hypothetical protein
MKVSPQRKVKETAYRTAGLYHKTKTDSNRPLENVAKFKIFGTAMTKIKTFTKTL